MADVVLSGIVKRFGTAVALDNIDVEMPDGALTVVVGPSGCGKSTLLGIVAGLEDPDAGEIRIGGQRVNHLPPAARNIAMVFQSYALYPHMTVFENLAFPLRMARLGREEIEGKVRQTAERLQIGPLLERRPKALSGGQQQRVAIGRAMVRDPAVYLFDEPLSNLDAQLRVEMREEIARLQRALGAAMVFVTHDQVEAMTLADRIVVLNGGRVEQVGTPMQLYERPANRFVAGFIGAPRMNFLEVEVTSLDGGIARVRLADGTELAVPAPEGFGRAAGRAVLGIRPEHLVIGEAAPPDALRLAGRVARVERLGGQTHLRVDSPAGALNVVVAGDTALREGQQVGLAVSRDRCHLFE